MLFTLRPEHLEAFGRAARESFEDRVERHLRRCAAGKSRSLSEAELRERIRSGIDRAAGYGISAERDVAAFLRLELLLGKDFDRVWSSGWARAWLERRDLPPSIRLNRLLSEAGRRGLTSGQCRMESARQSQPSEEESRHGI